MPIDCGASYVDASMACTESRVLVCLRDSDTGGGYFGGFAINGGTGQGTALDRGFQSAGNEPPYTQDFNVSGEPSGFQCFYVPYTVGTHSTDTLVIEGNDVSQNACSLAFTVSTSAACNGTGTEINCLVTELTVSAGQVVPVTSIADGGDGTLEVTAIQPTGNIIELDPSSSGLVVGTSGVAGDYTRNVTVSDGTQTQVCEVTFTINSLSQCIDCTAVTLSNVSSNTAVGGDVITFRTEYAGALQDNVSPVLVDSDGNSVATATYVQTQGGVNFWQYTVPFDCSEGSYMWQLNSPAQGAACENCDLFSLSLTCDCPAPVIDQCNGGSISITANSSLALSVSGCECVDENNGGSIVWSSPSNQVSFNPTSGANTVVTASTTGSYTINVTCTTG